MYLFTSVSLLGKNASFRFVLRMWLRHSQTTRLEAQQWLRNRVTLPPPRLAAPCFSLLTLPRNDVIFKVAARLVITLDLGQVFFKFTRWLITSLISCLLLCNRHTQSSPTVLLLGSVARRGLQVGVFRASVSQTSTRFSHTEGCLFPLPINSSSVNSRPRSKNTAWRNVKSARMLRATRLLVPNFKVLRQLVTQPKFSGIPYCFF